MAVQIQFRRGTAAEWTSANPILAVGELGLETDTNKFKMGTGVAAWGSLGYIELDLPDQTGNNGKFLTTDGTSAAWATVDALPSQTNNAGKYLTTDGTTASWESVTTDPTPTVFLLMGA